MMATSSAPKLEASATRSPNCCTAQRTISWAVFDSNAPRSIACLIEASIAVRVSMLSSVVERFYLVGSKDAIYDKSCQYINTTKWYLYYYLSNIYGDKNSCPTVATWLAVL